MIARSEAAADRDLVLAEALREIVKVATARTIGECAFVGDASVLLRRVADIAQTALLSMDATA